MGPPCLNSMRNLWQSLSYTQKVRPSLMLLAGIHNLIHDIMKVLLLQYTLKRPQKIKELWLIYFLAT
uniref:Uncharacterized protein n=1 Tax=Scytodes thoracica TaxID=1112478 RepID=A0A0A0V7J0_SCYTH|nr:hypothetical protein [Scytodes thoracica]